MWVCTPENLETYCTIATVAWTAVAVVVISDNTTVREFMTNLLRRVAWMNDAAAIVDVCGTQVIGSDGVGAAFNHSNASSVVRVSSSIVVESRSICATQNAWGADVSVTKKR